MKSSTVLKNIIISAFATALLSVSFASGVAAQEATPTAVGLWKTIDDKDPGKAVSLMRLVEADGVLTGTVEEIIDPKMTRICTRCIGAIKNAPVKGLQVVLDFRRQGRSYEGGKLLDPESGSYYSGAITPSADNKSLDVRGYLGIKLLGRSQTWLRIE